MFRPDNVWGGSAGHRRRGRRRPPARTTTPTLTWSVQRRRSASALWARWHEVDRVQAAARAGRVRHLDGHQLLGPALLRHGQPGHEGEESSTVFATATENVFTLQQATDSVSAAVSMPSASGRALSAYIRPRSWIASTTRPVPIAIIRMSEATRTKRYPGGGTPICTVSVGGNS